MNDEPEKSPIEYMSDIQELLSASAFMEDDALDDAMGKIVKLTVKPYVPPRSAANLVVELEALSAMFKLKGRALMLMPTGKEPAKRKGFYLSISESLQRLADAVKYSTRI